MSAAAVDSSGGSLVGQTIGGKFLVEAYVGGGAMGEVYRAKHVDLGRTIALKVMRSDLSDATFAARFQREAKAASLLDHPNTVRVLDFGAESSGLAYIAMEFLDGRDLYQLIKSEHPLAPTRVVGLLAQALSAMKAAHRLGIVHRDIKPENIMVTEVHDDEGGELREVVKVCDFGIAKITERDGMQTEPGRALTGTGTLMGTPEYMSPEQARGEPLDARSDLYSMGIVLFQMLTGRVPFLGESPLGVVVKQVTDLPPRPSSLRQDVDPRLEELCLRALEKRPEDRFQSAGEMRAALLGVVDASQSMPLISTRTSGPSPSSDSQRSVGAASGPRLPAEADLGTRPTVPHGIEPPRAKPRNRLGILALVLLGGIGLGGALFLLPRLLGAGPVAAPPGLASAAPSGSTASVASAAPVLAPSATTSGGLVAAPPSPRPSAPLASAPPGPRASAGLAPGASAARPPSAPASATAPSAPVPTPSTAPSAPAVPTAPLNAEQAFVRLSLVSATPSGAQGAASAYIGRAIPTLSNCYRNALKATNNAKGGPVSLSLSIDEQGTVISAVTLPGSAAHAFPQLPSCFQGALSNKSVGKVEAPATADVHLVLVPPP